MYPLILTKSEYDQILRKRAQAELSQQIAAYEADRLMKRVQEDAQRQVRSAEEQVQQRVEEIQRQLEAEKVETAYQRNLNISLLRISRERANADRSLKPKKEHTGYVVAASTEREHRYQDSYKHWKTVTLWETVLQSPYSVDFTQEQARKQMLEELFREDESGDWLVQKLGITGSFDDGYGEMVRDQDWRENFQEYNVMLDRRLRMNVRAGYWEIVFVHTKALGVVPREMRVR